MQARAVIKASAMDVSEDEEDYQELPSSRDSDAQPASDPAAEEDQSDLEDAAPHSKDAVVLDEGVSDLDYLRSRMKAGVGQAEPDDKSNSQTSSLTDTGQGV